MSVRKLCLILPLVLLMAAPVPIASAGGTQTFVVVVKKQKKKKLHKRRHKHHKHKKAPAAPAAPKPPQSLHAF